MCSVSRDWEQLLMSMQGLSDRFNVLSIIENFTDFFLYCKGSSSETTRYTPNQKKKKKNTAIYLPSSLKFTNL